MAFWQQNQYQISISNVNLNEPQEMPLESFQDQSEWEQFYRSTCNLNRHQQAQFGLSGGCTLAAMPNQQVPARSGGVPSMHLMESSSQAREDEQETMDRKQKRIIKNRESAARSRARKLAYRNELENKVACLEQELKKLKEQKEQVAAEKFIVKQDSKGVPIRRVNSGPY